VFIIIIKKTGTLFSKNHKTIMKSSQIRRNFITRSSHEIITYRK